MLCVCVLLIVMIGCFVIVIVLLLPLLFVMAASAKCYYCLILRLFANFQLLCAILFTHSHTSQIETTSLARSNKLAVNVIRNECARYTDFRINFCFRPGLPSNLGYCLIIRHALALIVCANLL